MLEKCIIEIYLKLYIFWWNYMDELRKYLSEALGLKIEYGEWLPEGDLPLFLSRAASYARCTIGDVAFVAAKAGSEEGLPGIKRVHRQLGKYTNLPVVVISETLDARQRKALVAQGVPFVVPGVQAFLPFFALAATSREPRRYRRDDRLSSRAQAAFVALVAHPKIESAAELRKITGLAPSEASRALAELDEHCLVIRKKNGRSMLLERELDAGKLLRAAKPLLSSPVGKTLHIKRSKALDMLPDAGETALAARSMLAAPPIECKAISKKRLKDLSFTEVLRGEIDDNDTIELQVWAYEPLVAGGKAIDDVSLALSLAGSEDERIEKELNGLFGEEDLW